MSTFLRKEGACGCTIGGVDGRENDHMDEIGMDGFRRAVNGQSPVKTKSQTVALENKRCLFRWKRTR